MFPSQILHALQTGSIPTEPYNIYANPYKAKRPWPPDFSKISNKHQFRLERRYKRRVKLKWARPGWTKAVKLTQLVTIVGFTTYAVLFMDWKQEGQTDPPFQGIRRKLAELTGSMWTLPERGRKEEQSDDSQPVLPNSK